MERSLGEGRRNMKRDEGKKEEKAGEAAQMEGKETWYQLRQERKVGCEARERERASEGPRKQERKTRQGRREGRGEGGEAKGEREGEGAAEERARQRGGSMDATPRGATLSRILRSISLLRSNTMLRTTPATIAAPANLPPSRPNHSPLAAALVLLLLLLLLLALLLLLLHLVVVVGPITPLLHPSP